MAAPTIDIVERMRGLRYVQVPVASELMNEAATSIETLRWQLKIRENIIGRLVNENGRLRNGAAEGCESGNIFDAVKMMPPITDEEREAIEIAADSTTVCIPPIKDTLRSLLDRLRT
jgi:hypothetical protein